MVKTKLIFAASTTLWAIKTVIKRKRKTKFWHEHFLFKDMKKNKIQTWDIVVTSPSFLEGNFYPLCIWPSKISLSPLIKGALHTM